MSGVCTSEPVAIAAARAVAHAAFRSLVSSALCCDHERLHGRHTSRPKHFRVDTVHPRPVRKWAACAWCMHARVHICVCTRTYVCIVQTREGGCMAGRLAVGRMDGSTQPPAAQPYSRLHGSAQCTHTYVHKRICAHAHACTTDRCTRRWRRWGRGWGWWWWGKGGHVIGGGGAEWDGQVVFASAGR